MKYSDFVRKNNKGYKFYQFENIYELANITREHKGKTRIVSNMSEYYSPSFSNTKNIDEAIDLLKFGWEYGIKELNKEIKIENISGTKTKHYYDVVGGNPSVPRYLNSLPTNMINYKRIENKHKVLNVLKDISYHAGYTAKQITDESVKAIQIIQQLEKQNYRVNLYVIDNGFENNEEIFVKIKIKDSGEKLNLAKMAFPLAHPALMRRILFKLTENTEWITPRWWNGSYGCSFSQQPSRFGHYIEKSDIVIPNVVGDIDQFVKSLKLTGGN